MKALILTTHTGGGHDAAAGALCEALGQQGVECRVQDCVAFGGAWLSKAVSGCYIKMVQGNPDHFGRLYRLGEIISTPRFKSPVYLLNATYAAAWRRSWRSLGRIWLSARTCSAARA